MKAFEFHLQRIMDLRQQQSDAARVRLQAAVADLAKLEVEIALLIERCETARADVRKPETTGEDLLAFSRFQNHTAQRLQDYRRRKGELAAHVEERKAEAIELERKVKLLERLRERGRTGWSAAADKELDELAADSHMAKLSAARNAIQAIRM